MHDLHLPFPQVAVRKIGLLILLNNLVVYRSPE